MTPAREGWPSPLLYSAPPPTSCVACGWPSTSSAYPWTPFLGGLLLNCLVCRCLNLGGPFLGVTGPPVTLVADRISALGGSRFMARMAESPRQPLASRLPHAVGWAHTRLGGSWSAPCFRPPSRSQPSGREEVLKQETQEALSVTPMAAPRHLHVGLHLGSGRGNESTSGPPGAPPQLSPLLRAPPQSPG